MKPFDLHMHSYMSDGTFPPEQLPALALEKGITLMSLTDHDTAAGCKSAIEAGSKIGVKVIPAMEIDAEFTSELHILAYGIDPEHPDILRYEKWRKAERDDRNSRILAKLKAMGIDAEPYLEHSKGNDTRLHIAKALVTGGWAASLKDAFDRYIGDGAPAHEVGGRISRRGAVELVMTAGGVAVLAHPCKLKTDTGALIRELAGYGMWGIEAFYPISTEGQRKVFLSLAKQYGLIPTCGSDFHGKNRDAVIGTAYMEAPELRAAYEYFDALS